jgi:uncharacterized protein (DUF924 family)
MADQARDVREYWFGSSPLSAAEFADRMEFWFGSHDTTEAQRAHDEEIRTRFGHLVELAARGELDSWADSPRRRLSLILLLDQFPRNIYRGTRRAFAADEKALHLTLSGIQSGADAALDRIERLFFYMPLQHSESLEVQDESIAAYRRLLDEAPEELRPQFADALESARDHRAIIERFGRFPHRNRALGRVSTRDEREFLASEAQAFGQ